MCLITAPHENRAQKTSSASTRRDFVQMYAEKQGRHKRTHQTHTSYAMTQFQRFIGPKADNEDVFRRGQLILRELPEERPLSRRLIRHRITRYGHCNNSCTTNHHQLVTSDNFVKIR